MNTFIALLRGINVGGNNKLPMRELVPVLQAIGLHNVQTYIQSGNIVLQSDGNDGPALAQQISEAIRASHGFAPAVLILKPEELAQAIRANPFPEGEADHKSLHLYFLDAIPQNAHLEALARLQSNDERFALIDRVFYLHAPMGIGRSKLAEKAGKGWGVAVTARNWRTVTQLMEMVQSQG